MVKWMLLGVFLGLAGWVSRLAQAERPLSQSPTEGARVDSPNARDRQSDTPSENGPMTAAADVATLEFVQMQEPELAKLLGFMKTKRNVDYRQAIEEIRRVRERLDTLQKRDQELYDVELAIWRNAAQLRLWAASISASSKKLSDSDRTKLTQLLTSENELTLKRLNIDKLRAEARLEQVRQQIARREQTESVIAKGVKTWEGRIERPLNKKNKATTAGSQLPSVGTP